MRKMGANYYRLESAWEARQLIGPRRAVIFAGYWTYGVPNQQFVQAAASPGAEWGDLILSPIVATEG